MKFKSKTINKVKCVLKDYYTSLTLGFINEVLLPSLLIIYLCQKFNHRNTQEAYSLEPKHLQPQTIRNFQSSNRVCNLRAPSFVENIVLFADRVSQPYIEKATDLVDENINRSVQIVQQYDLSITEQSAKLKQKGKEITDHLKENSLKTLN